LCGGATAQPVKALFFEAALAPSDMTFSAEPTGYSKLIETLRGEGMLVASMSTGEITREKLRPYQIVALHCSPERPLHNKEISALVWFVAQEGGALFIHGGAAKVINPLAEIFGISMDASNLVDSSSAMPDDATGRTFTLTNFPKNGGFQVEAVEKIGFYGGSPLILTQDAAPIAQGDEDCYSEDGFYSIGSFPPVAAVAYLGPGVVLVKSDRAMMTNGVIEQYQNMDWAKAIFGKLAAAHETSIQRDESILGLRSRVQDLEQTLLDSAEKIKKYETDLTVGYGRIEDLQTELHTATQTNSDLTAQLTTMRTNLDKANKALSTYQSSDVRKMAAIIAGAVLLITFVVGFAVGRRRKT
jgi:hypothetical protein